MMHLFAESGTISFHGGAAYGFTLIVVSILLMLLGLLTLPALIVAAIARRQAEHIRNKRASTIVAQYDPPRGLAPAEVGLLYDMRCGQNEIMATLFDLEQRGIVRIIDARSVATPTKRRMRTSLSTKRSPFVSPAAKPASSTHSGHCRSP